MLYVTDDGNQRVLGWCGLAPPDLDANLVLGQKDFRQLQGGPSTLVVVDSGNNRVTIWESDDVQRSMKKSEKLVSEEAGVL